MPAIRITMMPAARLPPVLVSTSQPIAIETMTMCVAEVNDLSYYNEQVCTEYYERVDASNNDPGDYLGSEDAHWASPPSGRPSAVSSSTPASVPPRYARCTSGSQLSSAQVPSTALVPRWSTYPLSAY